MFLREMTSPADCIRGAGTATVKALEKIGLRTVADLLEYFPRDYEDHTVAVRLADFGKYPSVNTVARVLAHDWIGFGRKKTLKVYVEDESARAALVCFNRPFLGRQLPVGSSCRLWGKFEWKYGEIQSSAFTADPVRGGEGQQSGLLPVYRLTEGLTAGQMRRVMRCAVEQYVSVVEDEIPEPLIIRESLMRKAGALRAIHFPETQAEIDGARRTLIYGELFYLEMIAGKRAGDRKGKNAGLLPAGGIPPDTPLQCRLLERLPFALTPGQRGAVDDINRDMESPWPMARILQGDVGSGKTLVSFLAALRAVGGEGQAALPRGQAAIMAPTELLARQHAESMAALLEPLGIRIAFLTGNIKAKERAHLLAALFAGEIDIVAGTHALFSKDVRYKNLRLAVVDEQHRFGVTQRQAVLDKGDSPHFLMMSATPIPRSLALTVFGDLDVSVIPDLPPGRKPVKTHLAGRKSEQRVYDFVRRELAAGRQAYFVYPVIGGEDGPDPDGYPDGLAETPALDYPLPEGTGAVNAVPVNAVPAKGLKAAREMAEYLSQKIFPEFRLALVHSRIDDDEKISIMETFRRGELHILVATSVVEVGVDVPNATCMVIEHADRFGLAALHQLRGRVGRGEWQSYCFLVYGDADDGDDGGGDGGITEDGKKRLRIMLENSSGFVIAEEDMKLRGPGQITGTEQSGWLGLGIADPVRDTEMLSRARDDAFSILERDPDLVLPENAVVREVLERTRPFSGSTRGHVSL